MQSEMVLMGSVEMLLPVVSAFVSSDGVSAIFLIREKDAHPHYRPYRIFGKHPESGIKTWIGDIFTSDIPGERVLIVFKWQDPAEVPTWITPYLNSYFTELVARLDQLGFVYPPDTPKPKRPFGFKTD